MSIIVIKPLSQCGLVVRANQKVNKLHEVVRERAGVLEAGIIDPKKVTRVALENAASVAGMILTTECALVDIKEESAGANR